MCVRQRERERKGSIQDLEMATRIWSGTSHLSIYISLPGIQSQALINCKGLGKIFCPSSESEILVSNNLLYHKVTIKIHERLPSTFLGILGNAKITQKRCKDVQYSVYHHHPIILATRKNERDIEIKKLVSDGAVTVTQVSWLLVQCCSFHHIYYTSSQKLKYRHVVWRFDLVWCNSGRQNENQGAKMKDKWFMFNV